MPAQAHVRVSLPFDLQRVTKIASSLPRACRRLRPAADPLWANGLASGGRDRGSDSGRHHWPIHSELHLNGNFSNAI